MILKFVADAEIQHQVLANPEVVLDEPAVSIERVRERRVAKALRVARRTSGFVVFEAGERERAARVAPLVPAVLTAFDAEAGRHLVPLTDREQKLVLEFDLERFAAAF